MKQQIIETIDELWRLWELPERVRMPKDEAVRQTMISNFCEAIALSSKPWQVEQLLNQHWGIEGGKFYEQ